MSRRFGPDLPECCVCGLSTQLRVEGSRTLHRVQRDVQRHQDWWDDLVMEKRERRGEMRARVRDVEIVATVLILSWSRRGCLPTSRAQVATSPRFRDPVSPRVLARRPGQYLVASYRRLLRARALHPRLMPRLDHCCDRPAHHIGRVRRRLRRLLGPLRLLPHLDRVPALV